MQLVVDRYLSNDDATLSKVFLEGNFECYGLEDEYREMSAKVMGETRIPAGTYKVTARKEGGFHGRYSNDRRFKDFHRGMLWIRDVPNFKWVLIHVGNTVEDTAGCLLVGTSANENNMTVGASAAAYTKLYKKVIDAAEAGNLTITFVDHDR